MALVPPVARIDWRRIPVLVFDTRSSFLGGADALTSRYAAQGELSRRHGGDGGGAHPSCWRSAGTAFTFSSDRKIVIGSTPLADQALDAVSWGTCGIFPRESPQAKAHQLLADLNLDCDPGRHGHSRS